MKLIDAPVSNIVKWRSNAVGSIPILAQKLVISFFQEANRISALNYGVAEKRTEQGVSTARVGSTYERTRVVEKRIIYEFPVSWKFYRYRLTRGEIYRIW